MIKGFKGGFVGLGKFSEMIFLSRFSTELPLKPFFIAKSTIVLQTILSTYMGGVE